MQWRTGGDRPALQNRSDGLDRALVHSTGFFISPMQGRIERKDFLCCPTPSATTMLPVKDMDRARAFYEGCLGLKPGGFRPDGKLVYAVGGSMLALFPKPEGTKADHTAIRFQVADIAA